MPYSRGVMQETEAILAVSAAVDKYRQQEPNFPWVMVKIFLLKYLTWDNEKIQESIMLSNDTAETWRPFIVMSLFQHMNNPKDVVSAIPLLFGGDSILNNIVYKVNVLADEIRPRQSIIRSGGVGSGD